MNRTVTDCCWCILILFISESHDDNTPTASKRSRKRWRNKQINETLLDLDTFHKYQTLLKSKCLYICYIILTLLFFSFVHFFLTSVTDLHRVAVTAAAGDGVYFGGSMTISLNVIHTHNGCCVIIYVNSGLVWSK